MYKHLFAQLHLKLALHETVLMVSVNVV